jgi:hypothetical protein
MCGKLIQLSLHGRQSTLLAFTQSNAVHECVGYFFDNLMTYALTLILRTSQYDTWRRPYFCPKVCSNNRTLIKINIHTYTSLTRPINPSSQQAALVLSGIATSYGLGDRGVGVRVPVGSRIFSSPNRPDRL